jgi:P-type E1-E2 ATPase
LVSLSTLLNLGVSSYCFLVGEETNFTEGAVVILVFYLGEIITKYLKSRALEYQLSNRFLLPTTITRFDENFNKMSQIELSEIKTNDILIIQKNEMIPLDGSLMSSSAYLNYSSLTGEDKIINKKYQDTIVSGSINVGAQLQLKVIKTINDSTVVRLFNTLTNVKNQKNKLSGIVDVIAGYFTLTLLIVSAFIFLVKFFSTDSD